MSTPSPVDLRRAQAQREVEANAKSVEILTRVKGWPEATALRMVYNFLIASHRAIAQGRTVQLASHKPPCEEIKDLLGRFPQHRAWTIGLECA
jgi:hypothetical protein